MKLELKHLSGYLPYGLRIDYGYSKPKNNTRYNFKLNGNNISKILNFQDFKPILRPLSDLTKHCDNLGFVPFDEIKKIRNRDWIHFKNEDEYCEMFHYSDHLENTYYDIFDFPYEIIQKLYEWHFDIHNLIETNLAIDKNTIV